MTRIKGLGRGLDALLGADEPAAAAASGDVLASLPIDALQPGRFQPRAHIGQEGLAELAESIKAQGVIQPIVVREIGGAGSRTYEIIAGERRWRASQRANVHEVPVLVMQGGTSYTAYPIAVGDYCYACTAGSGFT